jgi:hypothetical protein
MWNATGGVLAVCLGDATAAIVPSCVIPLFEESMSISGNI